MDLPDGVVTFLFTDIEGSTRLWEDAPDAMMAALRLHDERIDAAVDGHGGVSVKPRGEGDSRFIVFRSADDAVAAAAEIQLQFGSVEWPTPRPLRVRASLHTGLAELETDDYYGSAVNRAARLRAIAHGGQTVLSGATFELVQDHVPAGVTLTEMGLHRLKDLTRPEHVYQLDVDGLDQAFPPLLSLDAVPNNIPEQLTELVGREAELAQLSRLLEQTRLLTILAPGGTGKTRLAIQAAADHTANYPDGVFLITLADIAFGSDIVQAVAAAMRIALAAERDPQTQLLDYLTPRKTLLVFDNFEHLADSAGILTEILQTAPQVSVIATSRSRLNVTGETTLPLSGLTTSWDTPEAALQTSGVQLFVDAAQRSRPGFSLQPDDYVPLAQILELTAGMPLAILLAAAWTNMLSISDIANEIQKNLDFLESDAGDVPDRQRSIRAVFDHTWELLNPEERDVFAALSVFRGGFSREAAESIAGASLRDLATLTSKTLITPDPETGRYRVHELLRQYAQAQLEKEPETGSAVADKHANYYASLAVGAFKELLTHEVASLEAMERDFDNIRLAWRHNVAENRGGSIRDMLGGLWFLTEIRGWYPTGLDLFSEAVNGLDEADDETTIVARAGAAALHGAYAALLGHQPEEATKAVGNAVETLRDLGDPLTSVIALTQQYVCFLYTGRLENVSAISEEIQSVGKQVPRSQWPDIDVYLAGEMNPRGMMAIISGDLTTARRILEESRQVLEPSGELYYLSWNLAHRGRLAVVEGRIDDAIELFTQSADCSRQLGYYRGLEYSLSALGGARLTNGDLPGAENAFLEALAAAEKTSMALQMLGGLRKIAAVFSATDRKREAVVLLSTVVAEPASRRQIFFEASTTNELAAAELDKLKPDLDPQEYQQAQESGSSKPYGLAVKELIDTLS